MARERRISHEGSFNFCVGSPRTPALPTHQLFQKLAGLNFQGTNTYGAQVIIRMLLKRSLVFTDNVRIKPQYNFEQNSINEQNIDLSDGGKLALYLFKLKNGTTRDQEHYSDIQQMFFRLTGRHFDAGFGRPGETGINLRISISSDWGNVPLEHIGYPFQRQNLALLLACLNATNSKPIQIRGRVAFVVARDDSLQQCSERLNRGPVARKSL